jgi:anhydro-N-acetylmuramic acid kinase
MAAGGQGAPMAPAFHHAFFQSAEEDRVVVNVGGIANITHLPSNGPVRGFDTGPGNTLMDGWHERYRDASFDADGAWAAEGVVSEALLETLLADPFFEAPPPKSTGREHFNLIWLESALAEIETTLDPVDVQATLMALTVASTCAAIDGLGGGIGHVLICGGGARNPALMTAFEKRLLPVRVETTATCGVDPDFVEATGFAWLAYRTLHGEPGNIPEVTGAVGSRVLGAVYPL